MEQPGKRKTITIQDIADKLNISPSTVSRSLKNNERISEKTKKEVWQVARELGYQFHSASYFPDSEYKRNIGIIVPEISNTFYASIIKKIQNDARLKGLNVVVAFSFSLEEMEENVKNFMMLNMDGIILSSVGSSIMPDYINNLIKQKIPLVCIGSVNYDLPVPKIILDAYQGVYKAVKHLLSVGCKKITLMLGDDKCAKYSEMLNGYKTGLTSSGVQFKKDYVVYNNLADGVDITLNELFNSVSKPDAIITANYYSALKSIIYLKDNNLKVPQDVAVVSFGSDLMHKLYTPSVTSIHYSANDIGKFALQQVLELISKREKDKDFHEKSIITPARLIIRGSSMRD